MKKHADHGANPTLSDAPEGTRAAAQIIRDVTDRERAEESLRQASYYNRSLIEASLDPLVTIGPDGKIMDVNTATEAVTGRSRRELVGTDFSDYFTEPERARAGYQRVFQDGVVRDYPLEIRHRDGHLTSVLYNASVYRDESGQVSGVFAAARDVTRLRQAEETLRFSEQRLRLHVEQTPLGFIDWDTNFCVVQWNPAAEHIFGYTAAEALGRHAHFILPPNERDHVERKWRHLALGQRGGEHNINENVTKAGKRILCEWHNTPLTTAEGQVVGVASAVQDITERREAETQRELEELRLRSLLRISQSQADTVDQLLDLALIESLAVCESEFGFIQCYSEETRMFTLHAWSKAAMQECRIPHPPRFTELEKAGLWAETVRQRQAIVVNDYPAANPLKRGYPAGHAPLSRVLAVPVFSDGRIVAVAAVANKASDYTPQDQYQLALTMDAVWKVAERRVVETALAEAKAAAEAANRAKSEFLTNVSHELRTPLHAVLGMTELAMREKQSPTAQNYLQLASDSAEVLRELLNEILDFSRMEAGQVVIEEVAFDLHAILDRELKPLGIRAQRKELELCLDVPRHVPAHLIGDPLRLRQVVTNLVSNAIKFTERGEVVVRVAVESCEADTVVLRFSVADTGIGISPEDQRVIFDPFRQADPSMARRYGGTGLGLAIVSRLVRLMGGRLDVDSEIGRGSTFCFTIPLRLPSEFAEPAPLEIAFLGQLRDLPVLVVDRHPTNRRILCDLLRGWGMRPEPVEDARTALAQTQQARAAGRPFPLAIVDPDLPDLDGWDLIRELRKHQRRRAATIALVSSASPQAPASRRLQARALPLSKPVAQGELLRAIVRGLGLAPRSARKPAPATPPAASPRRLRILLAEDTAAGRLFATDVLQERGHVVQTAENGCHAFDLVRDQDFDVVLMDVQMPVMDGFQTTAAIRALPDPAKSQLPIVAMTAHAMRRDEQRCLTAGMNAYLAKPLRSRLLIETVERLGESRSSTPPVSSQDTPIADR
jgi:PAS domain S-box-containing protein